MAPEKECRFFWYRRRFPDNGPLLRYRKRYGLFRSVHRYAGRRLEKYRRALIRRRFGVYRDFFWDLKFLLCRHTKQWYLNAYTPPKGKRISGDISPQYWCLNEEEVKEVAELLPEAKIILMLRDPVERTWSHAKHQLALHGRPPRPPEELTHEDLVAFLEKQYRFCPSFTELIDRWERHFPGRVLVGYFDELCEDPESLFQKICETIGISFERFPEQALRQMSNVVYQGVDANCPPSFRAAAAERYLDALVEFSDGVGGCPSKWLESCRAILEKGPVETDGV